MKESKVFRHVEVSCNCDEIFDVITEETHGIDKCPNCAAMVNWCTLINKNNRYLPIDAIGPHPFFCVIVDTEMVIDENGVPCSVNITSIHQLSDYCLKTIHNLYRFRGMKGRLIIHTEFIQDDPNAKPDLEGVY